MYDNYRLSLLRTNSEFVKLKNIMINEWEQLISKKNYFKERQVTKQDYFFFYYSIGNVLKYFKKKKC